MKLATGRRVPERWPWRTSPSKINVILRRIWPLALIIFGGVLTFVWIFILVLAPLWLL